MKEWQYVENLKEELSSGATILFKYIEFKG